MIEAIIAIVIIFGFILTVMPKKQADKGEIPPELDSTLRSILEEAQNSEEFRTCLLLNDTVEIVKTGGNLKNYNCLKNHLDIALPALSPWDYAFAICPGATRTNCMVYNKNYASQQPGNPINVIDLKLPADRGVYTKSTVIAVPDAIAKPYTVTGGTCCGNPPPIPPPANCQLNEKIKDTSSFESQTCISKEGKTVILYLWGK